LQAIAGHVPVVEGLFDYRYAQVPLLITHPTLVVTSVVQFLVSRGLIMANSPEREIVRRRVSDGSLIL
jgi:hypothetical protein